MKSFYSCSFFNEMWKETSDFSLTQEEILLKSKVSKEKFLFQKNKILYHCKWQKQFNWDSSKPTIIIPIRDNLKVLKITLSNIIQKKVNLHSNVIVVDDRSEEDLKSEVVKAGFSYLRVDNTKGFNFSMLNNIATKICECLGIETIIFWNADLWAVEECWYLDILKKHHKSNSSVSGAKLVYPPKEMSLNKEDTVNVEKYFSHMKGKWRETVQFGGFYFINSSPVVKLSPVHIKRFASPENHLVNCDKVDYCVTGAFQIWNLKDFISIGGFNPSLSNILQDVDACLKIVELEKKVSYFGKNMFFYHDESAIHDNTKNHKKENSQFISDEILFGKIWNDKILNLVF